MLLNRHLACECRELSGSNGRELSERMAVNCLVLNGRANDSDAPAGSLSTVELCHTG